MDKQLIELAARAIWNIRRDDEDRCDMELEDLPRTHPVWKEAESAIAAIDAERGKKRMPALPAELYEFYPAMSASSHEAAVKEYARSVSSAAATAIPEGMALISIADKDMLTRQAHTTNEWADAACNGLQWMRNVHDRISDPGAAIMAIEDNIKHCREVAAAQGERND